MERHVEIGLIREIIGLAEQKSTYLDDTISHSPISRHSSPDRFAREEAVLFQRKPVVAAQARNQKITMATLIEDFGLGEDIQSGFAARGNPSHLFGRFEGALNRFNLAVEELISD